MTLALSEHQEWQEAEPRLQLHVTGEKLKWGVTFLGPDSVPPPTQEAPTDSALSSPFLTSLGPLRWLPVNPKAGSALLRSIEGQCQLQVLTHWLDRGHSQLGQTSDRLSGCRTRVSCDVSSFSKLGKEDQRWLRLELGGLRQWGGGGAKDAEEDTEDRPHPQTRLALFS